MKVISIKKEKILMIIYAIVICIGLFNIYKKEAITTFFMPISNKVILIDAGHGGWDPGKVGQNNQLEKDINLQIAKKLQSYLEQGGSTVIMTRVEDSALADRKSSDMKQRVAISNTYKSEILVSIHQNSFQDKNTQGAQVFYFDTSEKSKNLAEIVQQEIKNFADKDNHRQAKANENYYLLKKSTIPAIIVECGFLSNPAEAKKITDEEYQEKIAWAIYKGIIKFFDEEQKI